MAGKVPSTKHSTEETLKTLDDLMTENMETISEGHIQQLQGRNRMASVEKKVKQQLTETAQRFKETSKKPTWGTWFNNIFKAISEALKARLWRSQNTSPR